MLLGSLGTTIGINSKRKEVSVFLEVNEEIFYRLLQFMVVENVYHLYIKLHTKILFQYCFSWTLVQYQIIPITKLDTQLYNSKQWNNHTGLKTYFLKTSN